MATRTTTISLDLVYSAGLDEPDRGIFRNQAVEPNSGGDLYVEVTQASGADNVLEGNPFQRQIHLVGTPTGLEALGTYLIALARLQGADPEPHGHFDAVRSSDGGTISLIPRRVSNLPR